MKESKSNRHVKIDTTLVEGALKKASEMNIAKNRNELANFVLARVVEGSFSLKLDPKKFEWKEDGNPTTVNFLNEQYYKLASDLQANGYRNDSYFIFNILMYNFLHFY